MTETLHLGLPLVAPQQAQPHLPHNEALTGLDALVHLAVKDRTRSAPPSAPAEGDRHVVAAAPTGDWVGKPAAVALFAQGLWRFFTPKRGWIAWVEAETRLVTFDGTAWVDFLAGVPLQNVPMLGIQATADATTRFVASAQAALFTHAGNGMQVKINKNAAADTASLLFQTAFSGRAEVGLAGTDSLKIKVSADGASWTDALAVSAATGQVGLGTASPAHPLTIQHAGNEGLGINRATGGYNVMSFLSAGTRQGFVGTSGTAAHFDIALEDAATDLRVLTGGTERVRVNAATLRPGADNTATLGSAAFRWSTIYAATGTINTSDARDKTDLAPLDGPTALALIRLIQPWWFRFREGLVETVLVEVPGETVEEPVTETVEVPATEIIVVDGMAERREIIRSETRPLFDDVPFRDGPGTHRVPRMRVMPKMVPERVVMTEGTRRHLGFLAQEVRDALVAIGLDPSETALFVLEDPADPHSRMGLRENHMVAILWAAVQALAGQIADLSDRLDAR